ncbi:Gfo/Idh/MocA family protein [Oenococcus sicerae]|uniref:Gfo/Idh/MocA family oxidoreductase n=1 Tax=Oenococcus sicerae TaxID=2203724 RepID=A0AAJ1VLN2_9LACO|nr:Gfo/Idh/MocA family oxidoreductase [Oenococcus sicerae]MDN6899663.1 Gfo/Idh/MocA family oxidoreductase [Oenococcus sicerae]VDK13618.1 scyllo-inositol 2-dehydrogenase (NADP(+)) IolU {ECO:0000303/PubMed:28043209} [Oenococcus sicerae]
MNFGLIGPGRIAEKFALAAKEVPGVRIAAVASHHLEKAQQFADKFEIDQAYGDYAELLADPEVDAVYVAVINGFHFDVVKQSLLAKKAVLCEKPLTPSLEETQALLLLAKQQKVLLMEGMWTLFLPAIHQAAAWLQNERIGQVKFINCNFSYFAEVDPESRLFSKKQGGGALLDIGVYCVAFLLEMIGERPKQIKSLLFDGQTAVDEMGTVIFRFPNGTIANCNFGFQARIDQDAHIYGSRGSIFVKHFSASRRVELYDVNDNLIDFFDDPQENGFAYEIQHFASSWDNNETEDSLMPHFKSLALSEIMQHIKENGEG